MVRANLYNKNMNGKCLKYPNVSVQKAGNEEGGECQSDLGWLVTKYKGYLYHHHHHYYQHWNSKKE